MVPQEEPRSPSEDTEELESGPANPVAANGDDEVSDTDDPVASNGIHSGNGDKMSTNGGDSGSDENIEASAEAEEDESMAVDGELAELDEALDDIEGRADDGDPTVEEDTVGAEVTEAEPPGVEASASDESDDSGDADDDAAAVLDLTAEVTEAEAAFLAAQPEDEATDAVALDLSDRLDLSAELDLSETDEAGPSRSGDAAGTETTADSDHDAPVDPTEVLEGWTPDPVLAPPPPVAGVEPPAVALPAEAPAPQPVRPRRGRRMRARKVRRIIRYVDPWSVLKFSFLFYSAVFVILMIAGVLLWSAAVSSGTVDNMEDFIKDLLALKSFSFEPDQIFRASALGGAILVVASTAGTVLLAILFNLISDLIGGIRVTVVELETARPVAAAPRTDTTPSVPPEPSSAESE